ncbi:hypothetical protein [Duganella violaceipulchra]|uniref:DUF1851 domain-containing protein n=1 Tax=Duganella violaceipulchra TaxID=2849652 RepID=A0AA41L0B5_9BURK|nr:hypothetical protein [Duganella violaceicalia]MBV6322421.1 hypothetical protein [Duganella violaceicalia]MCP2010615.1 hypothetical protein [Duganella violaceicalia]
MNFSDWFSLTSAAEDGFVSVADGCVRSGLYEHGLITVPGQNLAAKTLMPWAWLIGTDVVALTITWSGDLFFWSPKYEAVFFLDVQRGQSTFVDRNVDYFFNDFLVADEIRNKVLRSGEFNSVNGLADELEYGQCYIQEPWARHGGGSNAGYGKGDIYVYFCLVSREVEIDLLSDRRG